ncbi:uncharacterized protein BJ212DRAFT_1504594, partial [Suillus subaureus]
LGSVTGPTESPEQPWKTYTNVLTLNTAGSNLLLFSCPSIPALESWATALQLSAWEKSCLKEMYTTQLVIHITLLEGKDTHTTLICGHMEGWVLIHIAGQTDWKHMWMVISGSQTSSTDPGASSTTTGTAPTPKKCMEGWLLVMPELEAGNTQASEMLKWLVALHDAFELYSHPKAYTWDPRNPVSLMFAYPVNPGRDLLFLDHEVAESMDPRDNQTSAICNRLLNILHSCMPKLHAMSVPPPLPPMGLGADPNCPQQQQPSQNAAQPQPQTQNSQPAYIPQLPMVNFDLRSPPDLTVGHALSPITEWSATHKTFLDFPHMQSRSMLNEHHTPELMMISSSMSSEKPDSVGEHTWVDDWSPNDQKPSSHLAFRLKAYAKHGDWTNEEHGAINSIQQVPVQEMLHNAGSPPLPPKAQLPTPPRVPVIAPDVTPPPATTSQPPPIEQGMSSEPTIEGSTASESSEGVIQYRSSFAPSKQAAQQKAVLHKPGRVNGKHVTHRNRLSWWNKSSNEEEEEDEEDEEDDEDADSDKDADSDEKPPSTLESKKPGLVMPVPVLAVRPLHPSSAGLLTQDDAPHLHPQSEYTTQVLCPQADFNQHVAAHQSGIWTQVLNPGRMPSSHPQPETPSHQQDPFIQLEPASHSMTKAFTPHGLLSAGMQDKQDRSAKRQEELAQETSASLINVPNKPPPPQTGFLGAITAHEREHKCEGGISAALTECEHEKRMAEEWQCKIDDFQHNQLEMQGMYGGSQQYLNMMGNSMMANPMMMGMNLMMTGGNPMMAGANPMMNGTNPMMNSANPMMMGGYMGHPGMMPGFGNPQFFMQQAAQAAYQQAMMAYSSAGSHVGDGMHPTPMNPIQCKLYRRTVLGQLELNGQLEVMQEFKLEPD